jgi:hypothetical protein
MDRSLRALMGKVVAVGTERGFAHLALQEDPFFGRLSSHLHQEAVDFALAAGERAAVKFLPGYGRAPAAMAGALQVRVTHSDQEPRAGKAILFSEYSDRPPSITVYTPSVNEANRLIRDNGLTKLLGIEDLTPMHLAHELYHHLEARKLTAGTAGFRVPTFSLGPLRLSTGLPSLCEIAADRFALVVLGLKVPPRAMQFVTIHHHNNEYAWQLLEELQGAEARPPTRTSREDPSDLEQ